MFSAQFGYILVHLTTVCAKEITRRKEMPVKYCGFFIGEDKNDYYDLNDLPGHRKHFQNKILCM